MSGIHTHSKMKVFTVIVTFALVHVNLVFAVRYNRPPIPMAPGTPVGIHQVTSVQGSGGPTEINVAPGWDAPIVETAPFTESAPPVLPSPAVAPAPHPKPSVFIPAPLQMTPEAMHPTVSHIPAPTHEQLPVLSKPEPEPVQTVAEMPTLVPETPLTVPEPLPVVPEKPVSIPEPPAPEPETPLSIPEQPSHAPEQISAVNPAFIPIPLLGASVNTFGSLNASQAANSGQTISFIASGDGMNINFSSGVGADSGADLTQGGSNIDVDLQDGEITTTSGETSATTFLLPDSDIDLQVSSADQVNMLVESHALGSENVDSQVAQQSVVYIYDPDRLSRRS